MNTPNQEPTWDTLVDKPPVPTTEPKPVLTPEKLDAMYAAPVATTPKPEDSVRTQEILDKIVTGAEQSPISPEVNGVESAPKVSESEVVYQELVKSYPNIVGGNFGKVKDTIKYSNSKNEFSDAERMLYPLATFGATIVAAKAAALPGLITGLAYGGGAGALTVGGVGFAALVGVVAPAVFVGVTAYGAYKLFKNIRGNMRIKSDMKKARKAFDLPPEEY